MVWERPVPSHALGYPTPAAIRLPVLQVVAGDGSAGGSPGGGPGYAEAGVGRRRYAGPAGCAGRLAGCPAFVRYGDCHCDGGGLIVGGCGRDLDLRLMVCHALVVQGDRAGLQLPVVVDSEMAGVDSSQAVGQHLAAVGVTGPEPSNAGILGAVLLHPAGAGVGFEERAQLHGFGGQELQSPPCPCPVVVERRGPDAVALVRRRRGVAAAPGPADRLPGGHRRAVDRAAGPVAVTPFPLPFRDVYPTVLVLHGQAAPSARRAAPPRSSPARRARRRW